MKKWLNEAQAQTQAIEMTQVKKKLDAKQAKSPTPSAILENCLEAR